MAVALGAAVASVLALRADDLVDLGGHQLVQDTEPDADLQHHRALLRCAGQLAESPLDEVGQLASPVLFSHGDLLGRYVPPVLDAGLRQPARSQRERTRREDRRLKFYGLRSMLGCLYSSSHCNFLSFASTSATIERGQPCPRMSRRPVTTSQTSHVARPRTPTNNNGDPFAMARFPAPAKMDKLPPATPNSRCHGRVKPLA